jgi:pimeloyl-ACP methyl ester carboxylesterase
MGLLLSTPRLRLALWSTALAAACGGSSTSSDASTPTADATVAPYDAGFAPDGGRADAGRADTGPADGGFADPDTIADEFWLVNGVRTHVVLQGTRTSTLPPLVVAHRGPATGSEYLPPTLKPLVRGRSVLFYDVRGAGLSNSGDGTQSSTISVRQHVADLGALVRALNDRLGRPAEEAVDLLGHEYGAALAMRLAAEQPRLVARLVLVNPFPIDVAQYADRNGEFERRLSQSERQRFYSVLNRPECFGNEEGCFLDVWSIVGHHLLCDENAGRFPELVFRTGSFRTQYFQIDRDLRESRYDWRRYLAQIRQPTTIISGRCDVAPTETVEAHVAGLPGAVHVAFERSGQFPMLEEAERFHATVRRALSR